MSATGGAAARSAALAVWQSRLAGVCEEMGGALRRAAYSANIKERADFSCAVFSPDGELAAQAEHIPVHLGSMAASVRAALDAFPDLAPGDQVALNDPFRGGTHLNDLTFVAAVADAGGGLLGYVANRAHHADVGGGVPGSLSATAVDSVAEGLCVPPVRVVRDGTWDDDVRRLILANTRTPEERAGDLDAQWGANRLGARRLGEIAGRHGGDSLRAATGDLCAYGERRLRGALVGAGGVRASFRDTLESAEGELVPVRVTVTVDEWGLTADFGGTGAARSGVPSAVDAVTRACLEFAVRAAIDPTLPRNGGVSRLLHVVAPPGSVVAARFPTPVGAGNVEASQRIVDVLLGALAQAFPGRVGAASQGTMNNVLIGGLSPGGRPFVYYETIAGGQGGRPGKPGMSGVHTGMTNTANTPVEALEAEYPLRVRTYRLRAGSGGAGRWPGGEGVERAIEVLVPVTLSLLGERRLRPPWGADGGAPGAPGEDVIVTAAGERRVSGKGVYSVPAGGVVIVRTPGGGGYGTT